MKLLMKSVWRNAEYEMSAVPPGQTMCGILKHTGKVHGKHAGKHALHFICRHADSDALLPQAMRKCTTRVACGTRIHEHLVESCKGKNSIHWGEM